MTPAAHCLFFDYFCVMPSYTQLSYLVIDENENNRTTIKNITKQAPEATCVYSCSSLKKAEKYLKDHSIDFILINPNFTKEQIFNQLEKINKKIPVVITSPRVKDAVKAYDIAAFDFILKPFSRERFNLTIERLLQQDFYQQKKQSAAASSFIEVRCDLMTEKIQHSDIEFIEAMGDYIKIVTHNRKFVVLMSMKKINDLLPDNTFFRTHKSFIINLKKIKNYNGKEIMLKSKKIPLSRFRKKEFKDLIVSI